MTNPSRVTAYLSIYCSDYDQTYNENPTMGPGDMSAELLYYTTVLMLLGSSFHRRQLSFWLSSREHRWLTFTRSIPPFTVGQHIWVIRTRTGKKLDKCHFFFLKSQRLLRTEKSKNSYTFKSYYLIY